MSQTEIVNHVSIYLSKAPTNIEIDKRKNVCLKANGKQGFSTIIKYLCKKNNKLELLGISLEDQALVGQWLEYVSTVIQRSPKSETEELLKTLNRYLENKAFFAGFHITIADIVLYVALYRIMENLSFHEKQSYLHLARWFNQVQHTPEVRQNQKEIYFQKNLIYSKWTH